MIDSRFEQDPKSMLPSRLPEDLFDIVYLQSFALLHAMTGEKKFQGLDVELITNIVSDILRIHDIYDIYKQNISGLIVMYASWIILEDLRREEIISLEEVTFEKLFDNVALTAMLLEHNEAFQKKISIELIREKIE